MTPWEKECPQCKGRGEVLIPIFDDPNLGHNPMTCSVCKGEGVVMKKADEW